MVPEMERTADGSSPLARGTRSAVRRPSPQYRFIPARAGNAHPRATVRAAQTVHPRSRGERNEGAGRGGDADGSSPLARGTPTTGRGSPRWCRFIPARAGNASGSCASRATSAVHPRSRGERSFNASMPVNPVGSSPLARGTLDGNVYQWAILRFIPARAGNALAACTSTRPRTVHPRSRGERVSNMPPALPDRRFIPARAGNARAAAMARSVSAVHPRSRGERARGVRDVVYPDGSSPLARGTHCHLRPSDRATRFIPARAGNAINSRTVRYIERGSSPLARGTR